MEKSKVEALWPTGGHDVGTAISVRAAYAFGDWPPAFAYEADKPNGGQPEPTLEITGEFDGFEWHYESNDE